MCLLIGTLKPQSNGPLYSNTVIGTLAVDGWAVIFGTVRRAWAGCGPEMTMGQWVTGHGSSGSTNPSGSRVSTRDPLTHDQVNKIPKTG